MAGFTIVHGLRPIPPLYASPRRVTGRDDVRRDVMGWRGDDMSPDGMTSGEAPEAAGNVIPGSERVAARGDRFSGRLGTGRAQTGGSVSPTPFGRAPEGAVRPCRVSTGPRPWPVLAPGRGLAASGARRGVARRMPASPVCTFASPVWPLSRPLRLRLQFRTGVTMPRPLRGFRCRPSTPPRAVSLDGMT